MIMKSDKKRFILANIIEKVLTDGNQVQISFNDNNYTGSFFITVDDEDQRKLYVTFYEGDTKDKASFELYAWDSLFMLFSMIDNLMFGQGELRIQRCGCTIFSMDLAD